MKTYRLCDATLAFEICAELFVNKTVRKSASNGQSADQVSLQSVRFRLFTASHDQVVNDLTVFFLFQFDRVDGVDTDSLETAQIDSRK